MAYLMFLTMLPGGGGGGMLVRAEERALVGAAEREVIAAEVGVIKIEVQTVEKVAEKVAVVENSTAIVKYDPEFAVKQGLEKGEFNLSKVKAMIPNATPNTFNPSSTISKGEKYKFEAGGKKVEIKWHSKDANAPKGSNSAKGNTTQVKVGTKLLNDKGKFQRKPDNSTHIPLKK